MYVCMYVIVFLAHDFFHTVAPIEMSEFVVHIDRQTLILYSSTFLVFSKYLENDLTNFDEI